MGVGNEVGAAETDRKHYLADPLDAPEKRDLLLL